MMNDELLMMNYYIAASHGWRVVSVRFSTFFRKCKPMLRHGGTIPSPRSVRGTGQPEPI